MEESPFYISKKYFVMIFLALFIPIIGNLPGLILIFLFLFYNLLKHGANGALESIILAMLLRFLNPGLTDVANTASLMSYILLLISAFFILGKNSLKPLFNQKKYQFWLLWISYMALSSVFTSNYLEI